MIFDATATVAQTPAVLSDEIPPQPLAEALAAYARQTGLQLIYLSEIARGQRSKGVPAGLTPDASLARLLDGTGLRFEYLNTRGVRILSISDRPRRPPERPTSSPRRPRDADELPTGLGEVVVTATAREDTLERVPMSIGVWTQAAVEASGAKDVSTIANLTPGVEFDAYPDYSAGIETNIAIRGINAKDGSTTAIYVDGTPIVADRASSFGRAYPVLFDLERIEVLRGPQGVLLGEGAEGGAVRFITTQPSLTTLSGFAHSEIAQTARGAPSYEMGAAVGGPLSLGVAGARVGAWLRRDGGFVDRVDPFTGATVDKNANWARSAVLNASATIAPTGSVQITPSIRYQTVEVHDSSAFYTYLSDAASGVLRNGKLLDQWSSDRSYLISLKATAEADTADVSSTTAYFRRHASAIQDDSNNSGRGHSNPLGPEYPVSYADATPNLIGIDQSVLSQQVRIASSDPTARLAWIIGAGYVHAHYKENQDVGTSALVDEGRLDGKTLIDRITTQIAAYGDADLRFHERLTASVGVRVERDSYESLQRVPAFPPYYGAQSFGIDSTTTSVSPRVSVVYHGEVGNLYYVTVAKGYRMGGPNATLGAACESTPIAYRPDSVLSYEVGAKNNLLGTRLQVDGSVYHIIWRNVQTPVPVRNCGIGYTINAGAATSDGFDIGIQAALTDQLKVGVTAAYTYARYSEAVVLGDAVVVGKGDAIGALPLVPAPWSATASAAYEMALPGGVRVSLHAQDVFHSRNPGPFTSDNPVALTYAPTRRPNPSTDLLNLRATAAWPAFEVSVFVNNALDSQPTLQRRNYIPTDTLFYATTFRPRTVGASGNWRF